MAASFIIHIKSLESNFNCVFNIHPAVVQQVSSFHNHISILEDSAGDNISHCFREIFSGVSGTFENRMERSLSILGGFWRLAVVNTPRVVVCVQERWHIDVHSGTAVSMGSNRRSCNYFVERASERARTRERERGRER